MKKMTLAETFEFKGLKSEALENYKEILVGDSHNIEAKRGMNRVLGVREKFDKVNQNMVNKFINIDSKNELLEFERWLSKLWI